MRPVHIPLPNSVYGTKSNSQICLFVKDPKDDFKELNVHKDLGFKVKLIDIGKLKRGYSRFKERRSLLKEFDIFLCDSRVYFLLKKLLGKPFYVSKKYPLPLKFDYTKPEEIKQNIQQAVENSSHFHMTHGPNYTLRISREMATEEEILKNVFESLPSFVTHILKWGCDLKDLKTISIKGTNSIDLPIFNQLSEEEIHAYNTVQSSN